MEENCFSLPWWISRGCFGYLYTFSDISSEKLAIRCPLAIRSANDLILVTFIPLVPRKLLQTRISMMYNINRASLAIAKQNFDVDDSMEDQEKIAPPRSILRTE